MLKKKDGKAPQSGPYVLHGMRRHAWKVWCEMDNTDLGLAGGWLRVGTEGMQYVIRDVTRGAAKGGESSAVVNTCMRGLDCAEGLRWPRVIGQGSSLAPCDLTGFGITALSLMQRYDLVKESERGIDVERVKGR